MLKIKFAQRLLAALLGLIVAFLACACTPEDMGVSQEQSVAEIEKETGALELSEMGAEGVADEKITASEQIEETISIEPVEPIYPEERETTLEKVLSFDIGIEGVFSYNFIFYDDPSTAHFYASGKLYTDGKGTFYHTDEYRLIRVNDGAVFPVTIWESIDDVEIIGNTLYLLYLDGHVLQYDISEGFESPILKDTIRLFEPRSDEKGYLQSVGKSEPVFVSNADKIYNLRKEILTDSEIPFAFQKNEENGDSVVFENGTFNVSYNETQVSVPFVSETTIWTKNGHSGLNDAVYAQYGKDNNVLSRVFVDVDSCSEDVKCEVEFEHANKRYTVESYRPQTVMVGETLFDELLLGRVLFDSYGNMYFAAYYTDRCDIYLVNAGYTGESFAKDENVMAEEDSIAPMSTASADSASSVQWLDISRSEVESNATAMINLPWTIRQGNLTPRNTSTVELPIYLRTCNIGDAQTGIPYCKGGYNGVGGSNEFATVVAMVVDSQGRPTAGNIANVSGNQLCTVGLDCARFLCKAFEFSNGLSPGQFITQYVNAGYGHVVGVNAQLHEWDVIISTSHAMFYSRTEDGLVYVYDVTSGENIAKTRERNTICTREELATLGYQFVHMCSSFSWDETSHFTACATCGEYRVNTNHNYMWTQYSSTQHKKACRDCGYYIYENHSWSPGGGNIICGVCSYIYTGGGIPAGYVDDEPIRTDDFAFVDVERRGSSVVSKGNMTC